MHIQALVSADGILPVIGSKLQLLFINLASVPGRQLVNSPTAAILKRCGTLKDILEYERKINNTVNPNLFNNSI